MVPCVRDPPAWADGRSGSREVDDAEAALTIQNPGNIAHWKKLRAVGRRRGVFVDGLLIVFDGPMGVAEGHRLSW